MSVEAPRDVRERRQRRDESGVGGKPTFWIVGCDMDLSFSQIISELWKLKGDSLQLDRMQISFFSFSVTLYEIHPVDPTRHVFLTLSCLLGSTKVESNTVDRLRET